MEHEYGEHGRPGDKRRELQECFEDVARALLILEDAVAEVIHPVKDDRERAAVADRLTDRLGEAVRIARKLQIRFSATHHLRSGT